LDDLSFFRQAGPANLEHLLAIHLLQAHLFQEAIQSAEIDVKPLDLVVHGDDQIGLEETDDFGGPSGAEASATSYGHQQDIHGAQFLHLGLSGHVSQSPQVTHAQPAEVEGEDSVGATRCPLLVIGKGSDTGDKHAADLVLAWAIEEFERSSYARCVKALGVIVADGDNIGAGARKGEADVRWIGIRHDGRHAPLVQPEASLSIPGNLHTRCLSMARVMINPLCTA
jgi:hypothetical protein